MGEWGLSTPYDPGGYGDLATAVRQEPGSVVVLVHRPHKTWAAHGPDHPPTQCPGGRPWPRE